MCTNQTYEVAVTLRTKGKPDRNVKTIVPSSNVALEHTAGRLKVYTAGVDGPLAEWDLPRRYEGGSYEYVINLIHPSYEPEDMSDKDIAVNMVQLLEEVVRRMK